MAHLTQCLVESEEKAQEFKYEIKIHLGAKRDLAKENRVLRQQLEAADRELARARERAVPPERVVVTGKGRCFHHEGCHHIYRNYNQTHIYNICNHCRAMFQQMMRRHLRVPNFTVPRRVRMELWRAFTDAHAFTVSKLVSLEFSSRLHRTADLRRGDET